MIIMYMSGTRNYITLSSLIYKKDGNFIFFVQPILVGFFFFGGGGANSWRIYLLSITQSRTSVVIMKCWRGHAIFNASVTIVTFNYHHCLLHFTAVTHHCWTSRFFPVRLQTSSATVASLPTQMKPSSFTSKCSFWHKCWQVVTISTSLLLSFNLNSAFPFWHNSVICGSRSQY